MNNPELQRAWQIIENTGTHLFLTFSQPSDSEKQMCITTAVHAFSLTGI